MIRTWFIFLLEIQAFGFFVDYIHHPRLDGDEYYIVESDETTEYHFIFIWL